MVQMSLTNLFLKLTKDHILTSMILLESAPLEEIKVRDNLSIQNYKIAIIQLMIGIFPVEGLNYGTKLTQSYLL